MHPFNGNIGKQNNFPPFKIMYFGILPRGSKVGKEIIIEIDDNSGLNIHTPSPKAELLLAKSNSAQIQCQFSYHAYD